MVGNVVCVEQIGLVVGSVGYLLLVEVVVCEVVIEQVVVELVGVGVLVQFVYVYQIICQLQVGVVVQQVGGVEGVYGLVDDGYVGGGCGDVGREFLVVGLFGQGFGVQ